MRGVLLVFKVIRQFSRSHGYKNRRFWPKLCVSGCNSSLNSPIAMKQCTMLDVARNEAWSGIEEKRCSTVLQGHPANFKVNFDPIERFRTAAPFWTHRWLRNDAQSLTWYRKSALFFYKVIHQISRSCGTKTANFDPNWAFSDCNSSFNSPMDLKRCTELDGVKKRRPFSRLSIKCHGHKGWKIDDLNPIWARS